LVCSACATAAAATRCDSSTWRAISAADDTISSVQEAADCTLADDCSEAVANAQPGLTLVRINSLDEALAALDRIEKTAGGDPYLDVLRAQACFAFGRRPEGKKALERFLEFGPSYKEGYVVGVDAALRAKDWGEMVRLIRLSRAKADLPWGAVDVVPEMAEFRRSAEYKKWKREEAVRNGLAGERF